MPKKTKKEKLLAQQHRTNLPPVVIQNRSQTHADALPVDTRVSFTLPFQNKPASPVLPAAIHEYTLMKRDLIKTVVLTSVILISEFLLAQWLPR